MAAGPVVRRKRLPFVLPEPLVLEHGEHIVVARDDPCDLLVAQRRVRDRRLGPPACVERIRVSPELPAGQIHVFDRAIELAPRPVLCGIRILERRDLAAARVLLLAVSAPLSISRAHILPE